MKLSVLFFLLVLVVVAAATSTEEKSSCQWELMKHSIDRCRSFLRHGQQGPPSLIVSIVGDADGDLDDGAVPDVCCKELGEVRANCRCQSIRDMVQEVTWEEGFRGKECKGRCREMVMRGKFLPAMCNMEPHTCKMN